MMSHIQQIRRVLICSCLVNISDNKHINKRSIEADYHVDLIGVCGFYVLTNCQVLLKFYALQSRLTNWLKNELNVAMIGSEIHGIISDNSDKGDKGKEGLIYLVTNEHDAKLDEFEEFEEFEEFDNVSTSDAKLNDRSIIDNAANASERRRLRKMSIGPMHAMQTTADGNCLLHAISICLWGVEDSTSAGTEVSIIRQGLKQFMVIHRKLLFLHFKAAERRFDGQLLGGIETPESDLIRQMDYEIACLDDHKRYLSALHVYCLANMLRRPIIVYCEPNPNGMMRGIYCPTMYSPSETYPFPLTVIWEHNHFTAVLSAECNDRKMYVPLFDSHGPLSCPYGWIAPGTPEYKEIVALKYHVVPYLSVAVPGAMDYVVITKSDAIAQQSTTSKPAVSSAESIMSTIFNALTYPLSFVMPVDSTDDSLPAVKEAVSPISPSIATSSADSVDHFADGRQHLSEYLFHHLGYVDSKSGDGKRLSSLNCSMFPFAERVPYHPARERLLGASWRRFNTVWVGSFKDLAWQALETAALRYHAEARRNIDHERIKDLLGRAKEACNQGMISEIALKQLYLVLVETGDVREIQHFLSLAVKTKASHGK